MAIFCKQCGRELKKNALFCPNCGTKVILVSPQNPVQQNQASVDRTSLKQGAAQKNRSILITVFSIVGMIVLAIAAYFIVGAINDSGKNAAQTVSTSEKKATNATKETASKTSSKNSEETVIRNYTRKLNALKIHTTGKDLSVGSWNISAQNGTLIFEANTISSTNLVRIFDLYDAGNLAPLQKWAKDVYYIADDLSRKLDKNWSIDVSNSCGKEYPVTLPSSDLTAYSGTCGYSIPVLSGENKDNLSLIITSSVFGPSSKKTPSVDASASEYIFPNSGAQRLTENEIAPLSLDQLRLARNEVYARHGYIFKSEDLRAYFSQKPWYSPDASYDGKTLSEVEKYNVELIESKERFLK